MSKYTTEVRFICETLAGLDESTGYADTQAVIEMAAPKIFGVNWPIYDENYRLPLEYKILRHFYTREIAYETVGLWQLKLCDKLNMIMPYYNKLYNSELYTFNPLYDVDITKDRTGNRQTDTTGKSQGSTTALEDTSRSDSGNQWNTFQDTPQGSLVNVQNETYLTDARHITDNTQGTGHSTTSTNSTLNSSENITDVDSYIEHVVGSNGGSSYSKKLLEFRETLLNIDSLIINELNELFFLLW